jgi:hypothetical protein
MKRSSGPRRTANLSESVHQQLSMYALAAGAAGVSALALVPPADAKIIYTKTNTQILANTPYNLDVNNDGTTDFVISNFTSGSTGRMRRPPGNHRSFGAVGVNGSGTNAVVKTKRFAADLPPDNPVWRIRNFGAGFQKMAYCTNIYTSITGDHQTSSGPWIDQSRYLGLKFSISGRLKDHILHPYVMPFEQVQPSLDVRHFESTQ